MNLEEAIEVCRKNGLRLLEDAKNLYEYGSYPTAFGLTKLSQEEFAKAYILLLVHVGALNWTKEVQRSLNHHISKQIISILLDHINPNDEVFFKMIKEKTLLSRPQKVVDALNIYVNEILMRWESKWIWMEEQKYEKEAKDIFEQKEEKLKQSSFYIQITKDGKAIDTTSKFTEELVKEEIETAERYSRALNHQDSFHHKELIEIFKVLKR